LTTDLNKLESHVAWIYKPGLQRLFDAYYFVYAGSKLDALDLVRRLPLGIPVHHILGIVLMGLAALFVVYSLVITKREIAGRLVPMVDDRILFLLSWLIVPPFTLFFLTYTVRPCFIERYTLYSSFPMYILAGASIACLPRPKWQYGALGVLLLVMLGNLMDLTRPMRPDWKSAEPVLWQLAERDATLFTPPGNFQPTLAYYGGFDESNIVIDDGFVNAAVERHLSGQPAAIAFFEVPGSYEAKDVDDMLAGNGVPASKRHYPGRWDAFVWELGGPPAAP
jgi:hypothetical protein